jgi:hypothetical protein
MGLQVGVGRWSNKERVGKSRSMRSGSVAGRVVAMSVVR